MPQTSLRTEILQLLDDAMLTTAQMRNDEISASLEDDSDLTDWTDMSSDTSGMSSPALSPMVLSPPSPASSLASSWGSMSVDSKSTSTVSTTDMIIAPYTQLLDTIEALCDEVEAVRVLEDLGEPIPKASQLPLLSHFAEHHPSLFQKKLRVNLEVFDDILDQISGHPVFQNQSNNKQLPVSIQLAIFLYRASHYGNACSLEDVGQWAGVSIGMVVNCTHRVIATLLDQHDEFVYIPGAQSEEMQCARAFTES
ncbi:hypothetical protein PISMIDRAFT_18220 [Pisolithus microcarpus 441]|uniref:Uncharacterized protein n=1 Tax=Pisolithus microcarpus 441 TaxID=765257 RepID=A0A0C9Y871_9AGAM|nr:hypothetical protein PISMIDRAFT_18220 [Pisolithus microcarpus 441]